MKPKINLTEVVISHSFQTVKGGKSFFFLSLIESSLPIWHVVNQHPVSRGFNNHAKGGAATNPNHFLTRKQHVYTFKRLIYENPWLMGTTVVCSVLLFYATFLHVFFLISLCQHTDTFFNSLEFFSGCRLVVNEMSTNNT